MRSVQPRLLLRLAQGGGDGVGILRIDTAAGKADLAGMVVEMIGPLGEEDRHPFRPVDQRHQDSCLFQRQAGHIPLHFRIEIIIAARLLALGGEAAPRHDPAESFDDEIPWHQAASTRPSGKWLPPLQTPSSAPFASARSTS